MWKLKLFLENLKYEDISSNLTTLCFLCEQAKKRTKIHRTINIIFMQKSSQIRWFMHTQLCGTVNEILTRHLTNATDAVVMSYVHIL